MKPWYGSMFCRAPDHRGRAFTLLPIPLRSFLFHSTPLIPTSLAVPCPPVPPSTAGCCRRKDQTVTPQTDDSAPHSTSFIQRSPSRDLVGRLSIPKSTFQHTLSSRETHAISQLSGTPVSQGTPTVPDSLGQAYNFPERFQSRVARNERGSWEE